MDYHSRIMNIQHQMPKAMPGGEVAYKIGHRDARHAAAGIALEAEAEIERLLDLQTWRPIETAPTDGERFLAYDPASEPHTFECWANMTGGRFYWTDDFGSEPKPTHWMPLPAPPEETLSDPHKPRKGS